MKNWNKKLPWLHLDENLIKQALLNIFKNAIAAMPGGGSLNVATLTRDNHAVIRISDTGIGIPSDEVGKIFEPYFTTKSEGNGLGLTIVYKVVKEHGGEIRVVSREGEGTVFNIMLPLPQGDKKLLPWNGDIQ